MKRICPNCKSILHKNDMFFCTTCGNVLPDTLQLKKVSLRNVREMDEAESGLVSLSKSFKKIFNSIVGMIDIKILGVVIIIGVLITICFYLLIKFTLPTFTELNTDKSTDNSKAENNTTIVSQSKPSSVVNLDLNLNSGIFGQNKVSSYIPHDVDLYIEFNDFSSFDSYFGFMGGEFFTLSENIKEKVKSFYSAFLVTRDGNKYWSFIVFPLEEDMNIGSYSTLTSEKIDDFIVISTNELIIDEVKSANLGTQRSLALNPTFVTIKNTIPVEGKLFLISFNNQGKLELTDMLSNTTSQELKLVINKFKELGSNYMVVK